MTPEQLVFEIQEQESPARLSATLTLLQTQVVSIDTAAFEIPAGTCLDMFFSNRFRPANLTARLDRHGFGRSYYTETAAMVEAVWHAERI